MISSPCINVCQMDEDGLYCQGCWRTLDEISVWSAASDDERLSILAAVAQRRASCDSSRA